MKKIPKHKEPKLGDLVPDIKTRVVELKNQLDGGALFSKADTQYIEAAYEQVQNDVPLSVIQVWVLSHVEPMKGT